ncbi:MAG: hypothetical protein J5379_09570 [Clostridiales bacterium]|nr:hypothetical protein [Clostridiales bacterium]
MKRRIITVIVILSFMAASANGCGVSVRRSETDSSSVSTDTESSSDEETSSLRDFIIDVSENTIITHSAISTTTSEKITDLNTSLSTSETTAALVPIEDPRDEYGVVFQKQDKSAVSEYEIREEWELWTFNEILASELHSAIEVKTDGEIRLVGIALFDEYVCYFLETAVNLLGNGYDYDPTGMYVLKKDYEGTILGASPLPVQFREFMITGSNTVVVSEYYKHEQTDETYYIYYEISADDYTAKELFMVQSDSWGGPRMMCCSQGRIYLRDYVEKGLGYYTLACYDLDGNQLYDVELDDRCGSGNWLVLDNHPRVFYHREDRKTDAYAEYDEAGNQVGDFDVNDTCDETYSRVFKQFADSVIMYDYDGVWRLEAETRSWEFLYNWNTIPDPEGYADVDLEYDVSWMVYCMSEDAEKMVLFSDNHGFLLIRK